MDKFFKLKENGTDVKTELVAGLTTFMTMAYIIIVNPGILSITGMDKGAVTVATILAAAIGTLIMALVANVPFAQAPGMGLNALFTFTVCIGMKLPWQQALAIVFICGLINILITVTSIRKMLILAIPESLQYAISGGIGLFIAYIGFKEAHFLSFLTEDKNISSSIIADGKIVNVNSFDIVPSIASFTDTHAILALIGLVIIIVLLLLRVKGALLIGILLTTVVGIFFGKTDLSILTTTSFGIPDLSPTLFKLDIPGLFADPTKIFGILTLILAFSLSDTFDTIGTFLGTGRKSGIFDAKDEEAFKKGKSFNSRLDRALFADATATSIGALLGTSNTTTYVESASGIEAGGRTGLSSLFTAIMFLLCLFAAPFVGIIPGAATAPALIVVGIMMMSSFSKIKWGEFEEATAAFFTAVVMPFSYSISNGVAAGFIFYVIIKVVKGKAKEVHPLMYIVTALFIANFVFTALKSMPT